jgi:membrane dipeptidase
LTDFGREVVREMNRLGMMVDVSHASDDAFRDVLATSVAPVIASHSSCRAVSPHRRNLTDEMLKAIAASGGVVQINFASLFIDPDHPKVDAAALNRRLAAGGELTAPLGAYRTPFHRLVEHFEHALRVAGPAHVGIGSDFDGVPALPEGMEDCSKLPDLTAAMLWRGASEDDLIGVLGENVLRVMEACESVSRRLSGAAASRVS